MSAGRAAVCVVLAVSRVGAAAATSCTSGPPSDAHYYHNFQTAAAQAPNEGWTPYWLGRSFKAGAVKFDGPFVDDFAADLTGGMQLHYDSPGGTNLQLLLYGPSGWEKARTSQGLPPNVAFREVEVAGAPAKLALLAGGTRPVNQARVYVQLGDTMVVAIAGAGGPSSPGGPDVNPLIDEDTFIAVLQHLRPYPQ